MQNKDTAQQPPIPFPNTIPRGLVPGNTWLEESVTFDPTLHLAFEPPSFLVDLNFKKCSYPLEDGAVGGKTAPAGDADHPTATSFPGLAFTGPFRLLSDAGVRQLRAIVDGQANNAAIRQSDARTPLSLRGLGYVSPFVRDLNRSAAVDTILSGLAREPLAAHTMPYNYSQVNVGAIGGDKPVDAWHLDSVDYVLVVILSDSKGMQGGKLEVVMRPTADALELMEVRQGQFQPGETFQAEYPGAGYAILMQGSKMLHHVTPVLAAKEPRMSLINSYVSRRIFREDLTKYATFASGDPKHITPLEFARHRAWRARGLLQHIIDDVPFPDPKDEKEMSDHKCYLVNTLGKVAAELEQTRRILAGTESDAIGFYDEVAKRKEMTAAKVVSSPEKQ